MTVIIPSSDLRNKYNEVSKMSKEVDAIYITKNGAGDGVFLSIERYEELSKIEMYYNIEMGLKEFEEGKFIPFEQMLSDIRERLNL